MWTWEEEIYWETTFYWSMWNYILLVYVSAHFPYLPFVWETIQLNVPTWNTLTSTTICVLKHSFLGGRLLIKHSSGFPISRSLSTSRRRTDELGYRLERPIHFECKLNEPMHIGMRLLHPAAADHSVSINRQQVQRIFSFSLRSRAVFIVLLQTYLWECLKTLVLADGDSAVVVSFVEWIAHIRLHYPLLCCSDHLPCALQHAKRAKHFSKRVLRAERLF